MIVSDLHHVMACIIISIKNLILTYGMSELEYNHFILQSLIVLCCVSIICV